MIGSLKVKFTIHGVRSLKEKRRILKPLKDRYSKMNVSVAEVDDQDIWQLATMGFAVVSNDTGYVNSVLDRISLGLSENTDIDLIDSRMEILHV